MSQSADVAATRRTGARGPLDRVLNVFSDVMPGEGLTALLLMLNVFMLLAAYYLIKTVREPWILAAEGGGAEIKSYASAGIAALLIVLVPVYSAVASRFSRVKLINGVTLFFIACLVGFFLWARAVGMPGGEAEAEAGVAAAGASQLTVGVAFFIWVGIFNLMVIAQFWAFANDVYSVEQGKRLFAIVAFGASMGAIAGSKAAELLAERVDLYVVLGVAAAVLGLCILLTNVVHQREKRHAADRRTAAAAAAPAGTMPSEGDGGGDADALIKGRSGFALVFADKYLLLIAMLMLILNLVNTTGEYILGETLTNIAKERVAAGQMAEGDIGSWIGSFYGNFFFWVNTVSAIVQALLVSRIIKWFGVRGALYILPLIALISYSTMALVPILGVVRIGKILENGTDYSVQNTARHSLFLPTSREAKYKAKQAIDTFFWRAGDFLQAVVVFVGLEYFHFTVPQFAVVNVLLIVIWLGLVAAIAREHRKLEAIDSLRPAA